MEQFLTIQEIAERYGVTRVTVYKWIKKGEFPTGFYLSERIRRWRLTDIEEYERSLTCSEKHNENRLSSD